MAQARRKRKPNPERGLITKVAKMMSKSVQLVSMVNSGKVVSSKVSEALEAERAKLRKKAS